MRVRICPHNASNTPQANQKVWKNNGSLISQQNEVSFYIFAHDEKRLVWESCFWSFNDPLREENNLQRNGIIICRIIQWTCLSHSEKVEKFEKVKNGLKIGS